MFTARITDARAGHTTSRIHHVTLLALVLGAVALAGCRADSPTGVADRRLPAPRPRAEHYVCIPHGGDVTPEDTSSVPPGGECPPGFDTVIWW